MVVYICASVLLLAVESRFDLYQAAKKIPLLRSSTISQDVTQNGARLKKSSFWVKTVTYHFVNNSKRDKSRDSTAKKSRQV